MINAYLNGTILANGIKFRVTLTDDEIIFEDELKETITWERNTANLVLVDAMVKQITTTK